MEKKGRRPPNPVTMLVAYEFEAEGHPEISVHKGERVLVLDLDPQLNGWAYARKENDNEGYIPASYIRHINATHPKDTSGGSATLTGIGGTAAVVGVGGGNIVNATPTLNSSSSGGGGNRNMGGDAMINRRNNNRMGPAQQQQQQHSSHHVNLHHNPHPTHPHAHAHPHPSNPAMSDPITAGGGGTTASSSSSSSSAVNTISPNPSHPPDRTIVCSFHRDYVPRVQDLTKYFERFGPIVNNIDIDTKKTTPIAHIVFDTHMTCSKVLSEGTEIRIPSASSESQMYRVRVYSKPDYDRMPKSRFGSHGGPVGDPMRRR